MQVRTKLQDTVDSLKGLPCQCSNEVQAALDTQTRLQAVADQFKALQVRILPITLVWPSL